MHRGRGIALVCAAMLATTVAPAAADTGDATLGRYARDTWASFTAMTDERSGLPADRSSADGSRSTCRRRRPTSARTCGARWRPSGSGSSATPRW